MRSTVIDYTFKTLVVGLLALIAYQQVRAKNATYGVYLAHEPLLVSVDNDHLDVRIVRP